jgi:hypothetical protein
MITILLVVVLAAMLSLIGYLALRLKRASRIPVESTAGEVLPTVEGSDPLTCDRCKRFDLAEGQAFLDRYPAARAAYQWVSPRDEARSDNRDLVPHKAKWQDFGACTRHQTLVWGGMIPAQRLAAKDQVKQFDDGSEVVVAQAFCSNGVDCYERRS